jgi:subtilase family serine protease
VTSTAVAVAVAAPQASAAPSRHVLAGSAAAWTAKAQKVGAVSASAKVDFGVLLKMRNQSGAERLLQRLSTPGSASYGKWLTNAQFDARYSPARSDVHAVQSWLRSQGFKVGTTFQSGMLVEASGSARQVEKVFSTKLNSYRYQGHTLRSNTGALSLSASTPSAVRRVVNGITGVDQGSALKQPANTLPGPPAGARFGVPPCSSYFGQKTAANKPKAYGKKQPYTICGYTGQQFEGAYGETSSFAHGINGKGYTVAITDAFAAPTILKDAQKLAKFEGQALLKPGQFRQIVPKANGYHNINECGGNGWYGEETLDVESVHAMAPGAKIVYVGGSDCLSGLDDAWASTIDNHVADVITNSWTSGTDSVSGIGGQAEINFYKQFSLEGALTGITDNFSSGDDGDHTAGGTDLADKTVEFPADLPYVTGVGGTSVEIGKNNQWMGEHGWQTAYSQLTNGAWTPSVPGVYSSGGGGGTSQLFAQPFYQKGKVPNSISRFYGNKKMRSVPDIAMPGDPNTGILVGETQVFPNGTYWDTYRIGGTSVSSPLMAGIIAVADQRAGHALGFVNPLYYQLIGTSAVHDIKAPTSPVAQVRTNYANGLNNADGKTWEIGTIDVQTSTLHSAPGYDDETGVGTPNGSAFFAAMARLGRHS